MKLSRSRFEYLCSPGSVNGGELSWFVRLNKHQVRDNTTGKVVYYRPADGGVELGTIEHGRFHPLANQVDLLDEGAPIKHRNPLQEDMFRVKRNRPKQRALDV